MITRKSSDIFFRVIHTENIGIIGAVFTPIDVWEITSHLALLQTYDEFKEIFNELDLQEIDKSVYEHTGTLEFDELRTELLRYGFKENPIFSLSMDIKFAHETDFELIEVLKKN